MQKKFEPKYTLTLEIRQDLARIETVKENIQDLPLAPIVLKNLRETARLQTTHYSTMIEGNRLDTSQVEEVLKYEGHFPGRERDEREVKGYYAALKYVEDCVAQNVAFTETFIQMIHALVSSDGRKNVKPTSYRDGQNVIKDARTGAIVYMPPEAKDVSFLMNNLISWIVENKDILPCPIIAGIAHYQFATIHPYYDGNGRTARLITTFILHRGGYDLKGLYSLEEYYARDLGSYYHAISIGPSHNYYMGREKADITQWVEYFVNGMVFSFEKVYRHMKRAKISGMSDVSELLRALDPQQRKVLELFEMFDTVTTKQISELFNFKIQTSSQLCKKWVEDGFFEIVDLSKRTRTYRLGKKYKELI